MAMNLPAGLTDRIRKLLGRPGIQDLITAEVRRAYPGARAAFPDSIVLPSGYGRGLPERAVEVLITRLSYAPGKRVLDVGYANIMDCHADMLRSLPEPRLLTGIDIATPRYNASSLYREAVTADVAQTSFPDGSFDLIWCISSLEHFGMDNSAYTENFTIDDSVAQRAVHEMIRLLAPGGQLLISVPYGRYQNLGSQRNFDRTHWQALLDIGRGPADIREWYFRHTYGEGWHQTAPEELQFVGYFDQANAGAGGVAVALVTKRP